MFENESFRPLAGISCNIWDHCQMSIRKMFPSPCGDKL